MKTFSRSASIKRQVATAACVVCLATCAVAAPASAVTIIVESTDSAGEGFNASAPRDPVGGNPGTTLGEQRKFVVDYAAEVWGERLEGTVPVVIAASFDPLHGTATTATPGHAAPTTLHIDVVGAPRDSTWYVAALANQFYEDDLNDLVPGECPEDLIEGKCPDIVAQFNSDIDNQVVLGAVDFYYGIDAAGGSDVDFLTIALHEIAHGLGLIHQLNPTTGAKYFGSDDAYITRLEDPTISPKKLTQMTDAERKTALRDDGDLVWNGPAVAAIAANRLTAGVYEDGTVQMFAPSSYIAGLSVDHLDSDVFPNELMEPPIASNPQPRDLTITLAMLEDIGWSLESVPTCGDANDDGKITSADALVALRKAVGSGECASRACNVNGEGGTTTSDALILLKRAVGQGVAFSCPLS